MLSRKKLKKITEINKKEQDECLKKEEKTEHDKKKDKIYKMLLVVIEKHEKDAKQLQTNL